MKAALFGLGKMGANMVRRLIRGGHQIIGYDRSPEITRGLAESENMLAAFSVEEIINNLPPPRVIWITCGNTSNEHLKKILLKALPSALKLLEAGEPLVEISDPW